MNPNERYSHAKRITLIGALINAILGVLKLFGGVISHSHALVADGFHSLSDLLTDTMVLFASKYGSVDADDTHPYGHQRIETAATLFVSLLLILAGCGIAWHSVEEFMYGSHTIPKLMSIPIIGFSIIANEALFHYTQRIGKRIQSPLITANAWHHRSDAASSIVVLIGIIGSMAGIVFLDALAAIVVSLMIIKMGMDYGWNSVKELVDTAANPEILHQIETIIQQIDGVQKIHQLRSRFMGNDVLIDVHILVPPRISVSEGHYIAQHVHNALVEQIDSVKDVIVHVDHEDDESTSPSLNLPNRALLHNEIFKTIREDFKEILFWNIHYLNGQMGLDIVCSEQFERWKELHDRIVCALADHVDIEEIRLLSLHEIIHP